MKGKIGLEEHFAIPETLADSERYFEADVWKKFSAKILDLMDMRLKEMDDNGMDMMILSLNSPAIQAIYDKGKAVTTAKKANDTLVEAIRKYPKRYRGLAALPMQDVDEAIKEMQRCIKDLGFVGVLVNGYSQIDTADKYKYLDDPEYLPFWAELEKLDVPFYMHPREPMPCNMGQIEGHPWLEGASWAFGVETATHTLRLMCSGIFDKHPKLKYILGHLGECLPFCIWRCQNRINKTARGMPAKRPLPEYMQENVWVTTSGQFHSPSLWATIMEMGADRVLFSTDTPFEEVSDACTWFDNCMLSELDRYKIGRQNIIDLFKLTDL